MDLIKKEIELPKEASELADGVVNMVVVIKEALADGFQIGTDIPVIITEAITKLIPAIDGFDKLDDEMKENVYKFIMAFAVYGEKAYDAFAKKEEIV